MNRLVALGAVLAFVSVCHTAPQISTVAVDHGNVGVGVISSGTFGPGSFSIGSHGSSHRGKTARTEDGDSEHIFIQATNHNVQQGNNRRPQHDNAVPNSGGTNSGNTQMYPVNTSTIETTYASNSENNAFPSAGVAFSSGGSIAIGIIGGIIGEGTLSFINKRPGAEVHQQQSAASNGDIIGYQNTDNEAPFSIGHGVSVYSPDASALEAIFGGNSGNNELSSVGNGFSNGGQGIVASGSTTGGHFGEGNLSANNKRPGGNVPQQQSTVDNEISGYHNTGNEAPRSIEDGANSNGNGNAGVGYNDGQSSTGYNAYNNDEPWIWNR